MSKYPKIFRFKSALLFGTNEGTQYRVFSTRYYKEYHYDKNSIMNHVIEVDKSFYSRNWRIHTDAVANAIIMSFSTGFLPMVILFSILNIVLYLHLTTIEIIFLCLIPSAILYALYIKTCSKRFILNDMMLLKAQEDRRTTAQLVILPLSEWDKYANIKQHRTDKY